MKSFYLFSIYQIKIFLREPASVFFALIFPSFILILFGSIWSNKPHSLFGGNGYLDIYFPSLIGLIIPTVGLLHIIDTIGYYKQSGILKRYYTTSLNLFNLFISFFLTSMIITLIAILFLFLNARIIFHINFSLNIQFISILFLSFSLFYSIGFFLVSVLNNPSYLRLVSLLIFYPMIFLSGATMPTELFPDKFEPLLLINPLYNVIEILKFILLKYTNLDSIFNSITYLIFLMIAFSLLGLRFFKFYEK